MEYRLFVYGTLRRGEVNHGLLGASRCQSLLAWVPGSLVDTGQGYPAMTEGPGLACGEIYRIGGETLARTDVLEDYYGPGDPRNLYERVETIAWTDRGETRVLVYVSDRFPSGAAIPFGDWKLYRMTREPGVLWFAHDGSCLDGAGLAGDDAAERIGKGTVFGWGGMENTEGTLYRVPAEALKRHLDRLEGAGSMMCRPAVVPVTVDHRETVDAVTWVAVGWIPHLPG